MDFTIDLMSITNKKSKTQKSDHELWTENTYYLLLFSPFKLMRLNKHIKTFLSQFVDQAENYTVRMTRL